MTPFRPIDKARIPPLLDELSAVLRRHGFALDIGDGQLCLYFIDSHGNDAVATLEWDEGRQALTFDLVPDDERWSIEDQNWLNKSMASWVKDRAP